MGHYCSIAPEALIFTELSSIQAASRDSQGVLQHWLFKSKRSAFSCEGGYRIRSVNITAVQAGRNTVEETWLSVSEGLSHSQLPEHLLPLLRKHRIREPIMVGQAANLTKPLGPHKLFSSMPLPIRTDLPVHCNASFILAEDRRSIRFDGDGTMNPDSQFNRWLLEDKLPPLNLFLIEILLRQYKHTEVKNPWRWWPGNASEVEPISRVLMDSFYSRFLRGTDRIVCCSLSQKHLKPSDAFLLDPQTAVGSILLYLRPHNVIKLPPISRLRRYVQGLINPVNPQCVRDCLLQNSNLVKAAFPTKVTLEDVERTVRFLAQDSILAMDGLPLLPLADGTLQTYRSAHGQEAMYFAWASSLPAHVLFPLDRLVEPHFNSSPVVNKGLNVATLNGHAVGTFIDARLSPKKSMTIDEELWIANFWSEYLSMDIRPDSILSYPLVRTSVRGAYVSIAHCTSPTVIVKHNNTSPPWFDDTMLQMGATIIPVHSAPHQLREIIRNRVAHRSDIEMVLHFLEPAGLRNFAHCFSRIQPSSLRSSFAAWARGHLKIPPNSPYWTTARGLPIWPALGGDANDLFIAANCLTHKMLPSGVDGDMVIPFLRNPGTYVEFHSGLRELKIKSITFADLRADLALPPRLSPQDLPRYRRLLMVMVCHSTTGPKLLVPDSTGSMVPVDRLYAHSEFVFLNAFETRPHFFVHDSIRDLELQLSQFGLHTEVNQSTFISCAQALHEDTRGPRRLERAKVVFAWYSCVLPMRVREHTWWRGLDDLRFIPRSSIRHRVLPFDTTPYVTALEELVSPAEVLRPDQEAVAWTQRGIFLSEPDRRLFVADLALGVPPVSSVVSDCCSKFVVSLKIPRWNIFE